MDFEIISSFFNSCPDFVTSTSQFKTVLNDKIEDIGNHSGNPESIRFDEGDLKMSLAEELLIFFYTFFFINNQTFKQSPRKSLVCYTISEQFSRANKRRKLNNPLREQPKTPLLHRKAKRNAHFWTCQFKNVHYIF